MIVYHSSNMSIVNPEVRFSRDFLDFGKGFYMTTLQDQAIKYAQRFKRRKESAWLSTYELEFVKTEWKILQFDSYDREWLQFVTNCRRGTDNSDYDLIIGGIANDEVILTIERYFEGEISENDALGLLKYKKPNNQYCIRSQRMIDECLRHKDSVEL